MRNSRLHITYYPDLEMKKTKESLRCTSMASARKILAKKNPNTIEKAVYIGPKGGARKVPIKKTG